MGCIGVKYEAIQIGMEPRRGHNQQKLPKWPWPLVFSLENVRAPSILSGECLVYVSWRANDRNMVKKTRDMHIERLTDTKTDRRV